MKNDPSDRGKYRRPSKRERFLAANKKKLPVEQIALLVGQQNLKDFLRSCAPLAGIQVKEARSDDIPDIEVLFDMYAGRKKLGYILKLWNSPMVRLGTNVRLRKDLTGIADKFRQIHHFCSVNHITLMFPPTDPKASAFPLSLETAINHDGLNLDVFQEAVHRFVMCVDTLRPLLRIR